MGKPLPDKPVTITLTIGPKFLNSLANMLMFSRLCGSLDPDRDPIQALAVGVAKAIHDGRDSLCLESKGAESAK